MQLVEVGREREAVNETKADFGPKSELLAPNPTTAWVIRSSNRKLAWSLNSRCYPQQQAATERSMSWGVTQLCSDVASLPARSRRVARLSVARLQSAGAGSGLDTKRSAHLARTSPWVRTRGYSSISSSSSRQSHCEIPVLNTRTG